MKNLTVAHAVDLRVAELLDPGSACPLPLVGAESVGALRVFVGAVRERSVVVVALESGHARGAMGVAEVNALVRVLDFVRTKGAPLVLALESSGARIDQGLEVLAAFRRVLTAALNARVTGVQMVAVVRSICYGGASMLAFIAGRRLFTPGARLGMSGPGVIAAMSGALELDPRNADATEALFGGAARAALNAADLLCADEPQVLCTTLAACLGDTARHGSLDIAARQRALYARLERFGVELPRSPRPAPPEIKRRLDALLPEGFETLLGDGVVRGVRLHRGREVTITGLVQGAPLTAVATWMLAESIITSVRARPDRPIVILYDSVGHAATRLDESLLLSDYLVHLAQTIQWAGSERVAVSVWILGEASGGAYVTLTAACRSVFALTGAAVRVLPPAAVASVLSDGPVGHAGPQRWLELGLIDKMLEADQMSDEAARAAGLFSD